MRLEGFDYAPKTFSEIEAELAEYDAPVVAQSARRALDNLYGDPNQAPPGLEEYFRANLAILSELPNDDVRDEWEETLEECQTRASEENPNPLGDLDEINWYRRTSSNASARVRSDQRWVDAKEDADRCYRDSGYADLPDQANAAAAEVAEIQTQVGDGATTEQDAHDQLEAIAELEARLQATFDECELPRLTIERDLYLEYFDAIVEADELAASVAAAEIEERIATFQEELATVKDQRS
jgi:uncharacterized small protein (DUF1192 family)